MLLTWHAAYPHFLRESVWTDHSFDLYTSIKNNVNPFLVMEVPELVLFFLLIIYLVAVPARPFFQKKKKGTTKDKKQHQTKK